MHAVPRAQSPQVSHDVNRLHEDTMSLGDHLARRLARFGGSWAFIVTFGGVLALWIGVNSLQLLVRPFDPYPYRFLSLVLSGLAAIQAPVILMSLNRQATRDRLVAEQERQRTLRAEAEVEQLHVKLDQLRESQWPELVVLQQQQISMLRQLLTQGAVPKT